MSRFSVGSLASSVYMFGFCLASSRVCRDLQEREGIGIEVLVSRSFGYRNCETFRKTSRASVTRSEPTDPQSYSSRNRKANENGEKGQAFITNSNHHRSSKDPRGAIDLSLCLSHLSF